jgi:hypothetical protein
MNTAAALQAVDEAPTPQETEALPATAPSWGFGGRLLFRFWFAYMLLYSFPFPIYYVPIPVLDKVFGWYFERWNKLVPWVGKQVFHVDITVQPNGSGDTTYNYVQVLCYLVISVVAALVWSVLDRKRLHYRRLAEWLRVYVRFVLAVTMISYGAFKVIPSQFPAATVDRLMQPFGDSSPMGLLWTFMGASVAYNVFTGLGELAGGLLLTLRRTTLLGALVCMGVLSNVVMLNFSYDVPVKLYSLHLFLMAVYLAAPDARRLLNVLILNRPAEPADLRPRFQRKWLHRGSLILAGAFMLWTSWLSFNQSYQQRKTFVGATSASHLQGLWNVEEMVVDGQVRPPLVNDQTRWRRMVFSNRSRMGIQLMNDTRVRYNIEVDPKKKTIAFEKREDPSWKTTLNYRRSQRDVLLVEGPWEGKKVRARLRLTKPPEFLLVTRGFHWINERPFNR